MFDAVRGNKRVVQVFLILITLPFAFWGVESYVRNAQTSGAAATVGDSRISTNDLSQALRGQQDRLQAALGRDFNAALLDTPEMRQAALESLIHQRTLILQAARAKLVVSDAQLYEFISAIPALQENGGFSNARYEALLQNQGLTKAGFESRLRQDLLVQQLVSVVSESAFVADSSIERWLSLQQEQRGISEAVIAPDGYIGQVKLGSESVKNYYDANRKQFELPEQVRAEYLVLSADALAAQVKVTDEEIQSYYDGHKDRYLQGEERRASHILVQVAPDASETDVKAARAKAEDLAKLVKQAPNDFPKLAKQHSQDPGSAQNGGDLGFFGRGAMVKPFEDAVFALKENQISDIVRSDFGFHLIKLTDIKGAKTKALQDVRDEIASGIKRESAGRRYAEAAETFSNLVYEQSDSLKQAAEKFKLELRSSDWISKGAPQTAGALGNEKLLAALFSDDAITNKRNTEAIEVAPNTLVSARVLEHKAATLRPIESVSAEIQKRLTLDEAAKLAHKDGEEKLARLAKGESVDVAWSGARSITRQGESKIPPEAVRKIFKLNADKLPAYTGMPFPGGYVIYKVTSAKQQAGKSDAPAKGLRAQYERLRAEDDFSAYLATLQERYPVTINKAVLEAKEK